MAHALVRIARPEQWAKNFFVLIPLVFGGKYSGRVVFDALWAVGCFCLLSSGVYCLNDVIDAPADRLHPRKRLRPVAAGDLSSAAAISLGVLLVVTGLAAGFVLAGRFQAIALLYRLNNALCLFIFKHRVIVNVLVIANEFVLRILAGCAATGLRPSSPPSECRAPEPFRQEWHLGTAWPVSSIGTESWNRAKILGKTAELSR